MGAVEDFSMMVSNEKKRELANETQDGEYDAWLVINADTLRKDWIDSNYSEDFEEHCKETYREEIE